MPGLRPLRALRPGGKASRLVRCLHNCVNRKVVGAELLYTVVLHIKVAHGTAFAP